MNITDLILFGTYFILLFLALFWLIVLLTTENKKKPKCDREPFFTTIVPAYNEESSIIGTLTSLISLDYPKQKHQIIVVNDGSTDSTQPLVNQFISAHPNHNITLLSQKNSGKARAMNNGLKIATGEYFACLDADSFVHPDALKQMLPHFEEDNVAAVCPLLKVKQPENTLQKVQWYEYVINMFYKHLNAQINCIHVTPGPFSVYETKVIRDLGGYDEKTITEDLEIAIRLQKHHYKIVQTFDAQVETVAPRTWKALFRQRIRWYKGSVDNSITYRKMMFNKKFGDFGMIRMPTIITSGAIAIILTLTLLQETLKRIFFRFSSLKAVNFDFITLLRNYEFSFNFLNLPFFKFFIATTLIAISFFVMIYSFKIVNEKIKNHGRTWMSLVTYLSVYALFISFVWIHIAYLFVTKKRNRWS